LRSANVASAEREPEWQYATISAPSGAPTSARIRSGGRGRPGPAKSSPTSTRFAPGMWPCRGSHWLSLRPVYSSSRRTSRSVRAGSERRAARARPARSREVDGASVRAAPHVADDEIVLAEMRGQPGRVDDVWKLSPRHRERTYSAATSSASAATAGRASSLSTHADTALYGSSE